jgi:hypothetical protein
MASIRKRMESWAEKSPSGRIWYQLIKEFGYPAIAAILWTLIVYIGLADSEGPKAKAIMNFFASLFFFSWFWGQYNRVKKQFDVKDDLRHLIKKLESQTDDIVGFATGGNTLPELDIVLEASYNDGLFGDTLRVTFKFYNASQYPILDFTGEWSDFGDDKGNRPRDSDKFKLSALYPKMGATTSALIMYHFNKQQRLTLVIGTRGTTAAYHISLIRTDTGMHWAFKRFRGEEITIEKSNKFPDDIDVQDLLKNE